MPDYSALKLGKKDAKVDQRTLKMAKYIKALPPPPSIWTTWLKGQTSWGMMANDQLGDCTIAGCGHTVQVVTLNSGTEITIPDSEIIRYYGLWDGYVIGDPSTDNGGVELDVLNNWRQSGFGGQTLVAYCDPDPGNIEHIQQSIYLFGNVYIGLQLPISAQGQTVWDVVGNSQTDSNSIPGSWGGHCVVCVAYDLVKGTITCITWGGLVEMTLNFWKTYCDEAHCLLLQSWVVNQDSPSGFPMDVLLQDMAAVTG